MPAPQTVVTFRDADGDEFPIALPGDWSQHPDGVAISRAKVELDKMEAERKMRPTHPCLAFVAYPEGGGA